MKVSRATVIAVVAWLAVAGIGSVLVWAVISRAGEEVVSSGPPTTSAEPRTAPTATATRQARPGTPTASPSPDRSPPATSPAASPATSPPTSPATSAPTPRDPTTSAPPPTPPPSPAPAVTQRTWQGQGGTVIVSCEGSAAGLVGALPNSGFSVRVRDGGPDRVEVEFEGQGGNDAETRVRATCASGAPAFDAEVDPD